MPKKSTTKKPTGLSRKDKLELARILKKARAFKAYYQSKPGNVTGKKSGV